MKEKTIRHFKDKRTQYFVNTLDNIAGFNASLVKEGKNCPLF